MPLGLDGSLVLRAGCLLAMGIGLGASLHFLRPGSLSLQPPVVPLACSATANQDSAPEELSLSEVSALCGHGGVVLADTRSAALFAMGHSAGALHVPCQAGSLSPASKAALSQADTVVVIAETTEAAQTATESLRVYAPQTNWKILRGGFAAWETAGLACASGPCHECGAVRTTVSSP